MRTKLTELLNIEYPIIQGAMAWVSEATHSLQQLPMLVLLVLLL